MRPDERLLTTALIMLFQLAVFFFLPLRVMPALPVTLFGVAGASLSGWVISTNEGDNVLTSSLVTLPAVGDLSADAMAQTPCVLR